MPVQSWVLLAAALSLHPHHARAIRVVQQDMLAVRAGEVVEEELLVFASSVDMEGTARDDLFLLANELRLGGVYESALAAAGDRVTLTGRVDRHARLLGNVVSLEGARIGAGALLVGTTVRVDDDSVLKGRARIVAQDAILRGRVERTLRVRARRVRLGGDMGGDVEIVADDLVVLPGTRIRGDLVAYLPQPAVLDPRVQVDGQVMMGPPPPSDDAWNRILLRLYFYLASALSSIPLLVLFPRSTARAEDRLRRSPWRCVVCGAVLFGAVPLMVGIGLISLIGIPLALVLAAGYGFLTWFAQAAVALALAHRLRGTTAHDRVGRRVLSLLLGLAILHVVAGVPGMGGGIMVAVTLFGQGAWCLAVYDGETSGCRHGSGPPQSVQR